MMPASTGLLEGGKNNVVLVGIDDACSFVAHMRLCVMSQIQNNWSYGEVLDENAKTHPMLRPYKTFSEKVSLQSCCALFLYLDYVYVCL